MSKMNQSYTTGVQHMGIPTQDMEASKKFYETLGFEPAFETLNEGNRVIFFRLKTLVLEVYEENEVAMEAGAIDHIAIDVYDIEKTYEQICSLNLNTMNDEIHFLPFWDNGVRFFTIEGPNKEKVEFSQFLQ